MKGKRLILEGKVKDGPLLGWPFSFLSFSRFSREKLPFSLMNTVLDKAKTLYSL
jgi:hypothetical protein